ncbi:N-acetylglucosamine kinase [Alicyclobacillus macrosporangiidus]|uniref:BadF-type ATPase n=1 Tax=Alicyclobacillus macrosporangiidus TaxID=392015 RepID=A0A1I7G9A9_9BACL|nr:BadF/BadG/BcrA/BcrD ATPase family protein [Alicyclobacillus macrosporangiidus]SFU45027.1 BadF-type ATPase [Alicyclobacillus macrosporangiidus]
MRIYAGVDGGGTKTQLMMVDADSAQGVTLSGPPANPNTVGWQRAVETVLELLQTGLREMQAAPKDLVAICAGMAGVDRPNDREQWSLALRDGFPSAAIEVVNDALPVLSAGTEGRSGVALIAGTGSIAVGEDEDGRIARAGGFGYLLGDEGSGFAIGQRGLTAAIQSCEGRGPSTQLWEAAQEAFGVSHPADLIPRVYRSPHPVSVIASFSKWVLQCAPADDVARAIIYDAIRDLSAMVDAVFAQLADRIAPNVVVSGGVLVNSPLMVDGLRRAQTNRNIVVLQRSAAAGAVFRAMKHHLDRQAGGMNWTSAVAWWRSAVDRCRHC